MTSERSLETNCFSVSGMISVFRVKQIFAVDLNGCIIAALLNLPS
jgi:hypothetical protein